MCGIIGFNFFSEDVAPFEVANHRGPDHTQSGRYGEFTLGHNRLTIIDPSPEANQPFQSEDGRYVLVFNGEIYNFQEMKSRLKDKYNFSTRSDTEVLLNAYLEYGEECVEHFNGMFAFAILDQEKSVLFCARDRLGIKPFCYYYDGKKFIFASEIKVILKLLGTTPEIDRKAILQYLHYLYVPHPNSIFKGIKKLPPGNKLVLTDELCIEPYWKPEDAVGKHKNMSFAEANTQLDRLLFDSVKRRMMADVPLGSFLSGGMDSSAILYYMDQLADQPVNTFTLGFPGAAQYDERSDAQTVAKHFWTNHHEIEVNPNVVDLLQKMVFHFDEPFGNPTALLIHELTKETRKQATVALAGDGGDEVFGGYPRYQAIEYYAIAAKIPRVLRQVPAFFSKYIPERIDGSHGLRRVRTFLQSLDSEPSEVYDEWVSYFSPDEISLLWRDDPTFDRVVKQAFQRHNYPHPLLRTSLTDLSTFLPCNLFAYGDAMSMANGFEVRFPLVDHTIVEFMTGLSGKYRIKGGRTKVLLKEVMKGKLPESIINKPKLGLNPPMGLWLKNDLAGLIKEYLNTEQINKRGMLNPDFVKTILWEHEHGKRDRSLHIWALIVLEEWFRQYID